MDKSVARKKPAAEIRTFNDASLVLFVFAATQSNGSCSGQISILLRPMVHITVDAMILIPQPKPLERSFLPVSALAGASRARTIRLNVLFTINIHNIIIVQQRLFSWLAEKKGLPFAGTKTY
jgi:hypothetical protein